MMTTTTPLLGFNNRFQTPQFTEGYLNHVRSYISSYARAWNPYFFNFIEGSRSRLTVLNSSKVYNQFKRIAYFIRQLYSKNGKLLIVNEFESKEFTQYKGMTIFNKWIPGILTNKPIYFRILKKNGYLLQLPSLVFLMKTQLNNVSFLNEARRLRIPSASFVEAHYNHLISDYVSLLKVDQTSSSYYMNLFNSLHKDTFQNVAFMYASKRLSLVRHKNRNLTPKSKSTVLNKFRRLGKFVLSYLDKRYNIIRKFKFAFKRLNVFRPSITKRFHNPIRFKFISKMKNPKTVKYEARLIFGSFLTDFRQMLMMDNRSFIKNRKRSLKVRTKSKKSSLSLFRRLKPKKSFTIKRMRIRSIFSKLKKRLFKELNESKEKRKVRLVLSQMRIGKIKPRSRYRQLIITERLYERRAMRSLFIPRNYNRRSIKVKAKKLNLSKRKMLYMYRRRYLSYVNGPILERFLEEKRRKLERKNRARPKRGGLPRSTYYNKRFNNALVKEGKKPFHKRKKRHSKKKKSRNARFKNYVK